jgi:hypothetical protein
MRITLFAILSLSATAAFAQKVSLRGVLQDSASTPLPSATVLLLNPADSSLLNFAPSDTEGKFLFRNIAARNYLLKITYVGYLAHTQIVQLTPAADIIDVGVIKLQTESKRLNEVTVSAEKAPVVIKKDTIEFNAPSFKTQENALVEELLKKLPGVEVDNDGTIRAQGEKVQRVTVDGKSFFGSDPKLATRNLPADAVSKVQVFDKKSEQALFTGIDDGQREKTINLELKEEKRKGAFGNLTAGGGHDSRFTARASVNRFRKGKQLSFLGMANNVNEQGFGIEEYMNFTGGSQQMASGRGAVRVEINGENTGGVPLSFGNRPTGIMTNYAAGANFNHDFNKDTEVNGSYFYNHLDHTTSARLTRENFFPQGTFKYNESSRQDNSNDNHRLNFFVDHKIDSMNSLKLSGNASYNVTAATTGSESFLFNPSGETINSSRSLSSASGSSSRLNSSLLWRHRFNKKGRTLSSTLSFSGSVSDRVGGLEALLSNVEKGDSLLRQRSNQESDGWNYGLVTSYVEPLGKRKYLEFNYSYKQTRNTFVRSVFDQHNNEQLQNAAVSTEYVSGFQYHRAGLNFKINRKDHSATVGTSIQKAELNGKFRKTGVEINKSFQSILPVARMNFSFAGTKHLEIAYETSVQEPSIEQLQPVLDNSDPLNLYIGNPDLRPSYLQNFRVHYGAFNPVSFINFFAFIESTFTNNAITISQSITPGGVRLTKPVNVNDYKIAQVNASFGFPITMLKSRFSVGVNANHQSGTTLLNEESNRTIQSTLGGRVRYDLHIGDIFNLGVAANLSRQFADYELELQPDQSFYNNVYSADAGLTLIKNWLLSSSFELLEYKNHRAGYSQTVPLLNLSLSRYFLKAKSGELKISVNNLLDQDIAVTQSTGLNYLERRETNALGRYILCSFTYALNRQLNPLGMRRGGVMRVIH